MGYLEGQGDLVGSRFKVGIIIGFRGLGFRVIICQSTGGFIWYRRPHEEHIYH